jgi:predicted metal-binding protein
MDVAPSAVRSTTDDVLDEAEPRTGATLFVCVTCKGKAAEDEVREGRRLHDALIDTHRVHGHDRALKIVPVECLSNCNRACTVALAAPDRWTYVYGDLGVDTAPDILRGAALYAATPDGLVPWRERPEILKKGVVARVPPLPSTKE